MSKKRIKPEAFIECPFDEEDIISKNDYDNFMDNSGNSEQDSEKNTTNLFYFQSNI